MSGLAAGGARPDRDLHVLIERGEKLHQAFDGELGKAVAFQGRDFGLRHSEYRGNFALFKLSRLEQFIDLLMASTVSCSLSSAPRCFAVPAYSPASTSNSASALNSCACFQEKSWPVGLLPVPLHERLKPPLSLTSARSACRLNKCGFRATQAQEGAWRRIEPTAG